jgi:hypothetical protein
MRMVVMTPPFAIRLREQAHDLMRRFVQTKKRGQGELAGAHHHDS